MREQTTLADAPEKCAAAQNAAHSEESDAALFVASGFVGRVTCASTLSFVKEHDLRTRRYPLHWIIQKALRENERVCWQVRWDRNAYDVWRVHQGASRLHIPSGIFSQDERACHDAWYVFSQPLAVHEAMAFYDILNEARYSR